MFMPNVLPLLDTKVMIPPPEKPQTEADKAYVVQYEQWLNEHSRKFDQCLRVYETEILSLWKQKKIMG